jgi:hypothetical protein
MAGASDGRSRGRQEWGQAGAGAGQEQMMQGPTSRIGEEGSQAQGYF